MSAPMVGSSIRTNISNDGPSLPLAQDSLLASDWTIVKETYSPTVFTKIVSSFIKELGYSPPVSPDDTEKDLMKTQTYKSLHSALSIYNNDDKSFETICLTAVTITELSYPHHSLEVKLHIAKFTWYLVYLDDKADEVFSELKTFQDRFFQHQGSNNAILRDFRENLAEMYKFWDPIAANCIAVSGLDFVTGLLMEEDPEVRGMELSDVASSWPYFLRLKTGAAAAYAFMLFPKDRWSNVSVYIQVIDDITFIINLLNDLLSYHKEALAGETNIYIHARAHVTGKPVSETLQDIANDLLAANSRITQVLSKSVEGTTAWRHFINGYSDFGFCSKRYRLSELDFQAVKPML